MGQGVDAATVEIGPAPIDPAIADAEIVWNKRFFRPGVWTHELVGGRDFSPWGDRVLSDPLTDVERALRFIPGDGADLIMMIGLNVVDALRMHPIVTWSCRFAGGVSPQALEHYFSIEKLVTLGTTFTGWSGKYEAACNPRNVLILRTSLKEGKAGIIAQECGSSYRMMDPRQGVLLINCA